MKKIAIITCKGGTGKTTTAINLGHCLALSGKKVLIVDCDSQANVGMAFQKQPQKGLSELMTTGDVEIVNLRPNLYLIDSGGMRIVETELHLARQPERELRLRQVLSKLHGTDYVICDCPPAINLINVNVLNYVDGVVIPVSMDFFACEGAKKTIKLLDDIYAKIGHKVELMGILATFYDVRTRVSKTIYNQLLTEYADKVFTTRIRINTQLKEAQMLYKTIFEHAPYSNGALDYFLFAKEIAGLDRAEPLVETPQGEAWTT
ncbi:MAG: ParA family protein [candidate division Zixibacteria bacterium]|nr:ParA family protein [candidate division Zixibacteria bacterium]